MKHSRLLCLFLVFCVLKVQSSPLIRDDQKLSDYRLPKSISPNRYELNLQLSEDASTFGRYLGDVTISLIVKEDNVTAIKLHASRLDIITTELKNDKNKEIPLISRDYNVTTEILTLNYEKLTKNASYSLFIEYMGTLGNDDMYGFYQSSYLNDKKVEHLASTQFETVYARRAFPCFDEPEFKATFLIKVDYPATMSFISNMPADNTTTNAGLKTTIFKESPKMSTYLVAFLLSKFTSISSTVNDIPVSVLSRPGTEKNRQVAFDITPKILKDLGTYLGHKYIDLGVPKMDIVAIPDFAAGAMENWGLVTFREYTILDDGDDTSNAIKQEISSTIAHELAHQWFGDLATLDWWSDAWLNEGFATYFAMDSLNRVNNVFEVDKQFVPNTLQAVLQTDALSSALPLSSKAEDINTQAETLSKFDSISYSKGACIIRMMKSFLTEEVFQKGLTTYLETNKHKNVGVQDLLTSFNAPKLPFKLGEIMKDWVESPGFPIVTVSYNNGKLTLSQTRYSADSANDSVWYVPISYTTSTDVSKFDDTTPTEWLTKKQQIFDLTLKDDEWIILNNQATGYYRVNYAEGLWKKIIKVLGTTNFTTIDNINRAQLIDDIFNLAKIGKINYKYAFELSNYLVKETDYHVWTSAFNAYKYLLKRTGESSVLGQAISAKLKDLMAGLLKSVPIGTDLSSKHIDSLNQAQAHRWACNLGDTTTIKTVRELFHNYKNASTKIKADLRSAVYCCAIRNAAKPATANETSDWDFLWGKYSTASVAEKNVILNALGCTKDAATLKKYLQKSIDPNSGIRKQDASSVFQAVYSANPEGVSVALDFLKENITEITNYYKGMMSLSKIISGLSDSFTTQKQIDELKELLKQDGVADEIKIIGQQAVESATHNINWLTKFEKDLKIIFNIDDHDGGGGDGGAASVQIGITFIITTLITLYSLL